MRPVPARLTAVLLGLAPAVASAQVTPPQLPASFVAPNFDRVFVGVEESHEAGAYLARTRGPASTWYNAAGLGTLDRSSVSVNVRGVKLATLALDEPFQSGSQISDFGVLPLFLAVALGSDVLPWKDVRLGFSGTEQSSWNTLAWWGSTDSSGHSTYVSDSSFSSYVVAANVAWAVSPRFRAGASLGGMYTRLWQNDRLSALSAPAGVEGTVRTRLLSGYVLHAVPSLSLQWEPRDWLALGAVVRAPAWRVYGDATLQIERQDTSSSGSSNAFLQTGQATFDYRYPLEVQGGVAVRSERWEVEVDARFHASAGSYTLAGSDVPLQQVSTPPGGPPVTSPPVAIPYRSRAVVDVSLGGSVALGAEWRLHGGVYACPSPVASDAQEFRQTDLYGGRLGISYRGPKIAGSIGLGYETGNSTATPDLTSLAGVPVEDTLRIQQVSLTFAAEYWR